MMNRQIKIKKIIDIVKALLLVPQSKFNPWKREIRLLGEYIRQVPLLTLAALCSLTVAVTLSVKFLNDFTGYLHKVI